MATVHPHSITIPQLWTYCGQGAGQEDPVGCRGVVIPGYSCCLAHLSSADQNVYLATLAPGADIDLRGTRIDALLLNSLLGCLHDPASNRPSFGEAKFIAATFTSDAFFSSATFARTAFFDSAVFAGDVQFGSAAVFAGNVRFGSATFNGTAGFGQVTFTMNAGFGSATFNGAADFNSATFAGEAFFDRATFSGEATFNRIACNEAVFFNHATFTRDTSFRSAKFARSADFASATFARAAEFTSVTCAATADYSSATFAGAADFALATFDSAQFWQATFADLPWFGPVLCRRELNFTGARFSGAQVVVEATTPRIRLDAAVISGTASLRLRFAEVSMDRTVLSQPVALQAWPAPHALPPVGALDETLLTAQGCQPTVRLAGIEGVDAAQLVLTDLDLTGCRFAGAFHLEQIRIGFGCTFPRSPTGWRRHHGWLPFRWSPRQSLAEEQHWRALSPGPRGQGWAQGPDHPAEALTPGPDDLTGLYQQLRKAFEDGGNEPDAADFYFGEMEMRRIDPRRPRAERLLLWLYWLASGYGLRASRALAWLGVAMASTMLVLMLIGLPNADPRPIIAGSDRAGAVKLVSDTPDPALTLPFGRRITQPRFEKAALVVVNSVVFRSSGQNLTTWGTLIEMLSRICEPVLLTLAALAVRGRVKR